MLHVERLLVEPTWKLFDEIKVFAGHEEQKPGWLCVLDSKLRLCLSLEWRVRQLLRAHASFGNEHGPGNFWGKQRIIGTK